MLIFLDPGHGGVDKGCGPFGGLYEADLVHDLSRTVKTYLEDLIVLSRTAAECPSFVTRAARAEAAMADAALILHLNSGNRPSRTEFYYHGVLPDVWRPLKLLYPQCKIFDATTELGKKNSPHAENLLRPYHFKGIPVVLVELEYLNDPKIYTKFQDKAERDKTAHYLAGALLHCVEQAWRSRLS